MELYVRKPLARTEAFREHPRRQYGRDPGDLKGPDGHDSQRAAMIYPHGSDARQHEIPDSLTKLAREELKRRRSTDADVSGIK
jgi:hypothetical protein